MTDEKITQLMMQSGLHELLEEYMPGAGQWADMSEPMKEFVRLVEVETLKERNEP